MIGSKYIEENISRLDNQLDCPKFYWDEEFQQQQNCILPIGHNGKHIDWSGVEFVDTKS
jgi:hypothetical protein